MTLLLAAALLVPAPSQAMLIPRPDLTTLCFLSTDVIEARLIRHHIPGQEEWKDTFTATVLSSLEGRYEPGSQINRLDLQQYSADQVGSHCILFLQCASLSGSPLKAAAPQVVDMLLIDSHNYIHRYFQQSDPGLLGAEAHSPNYHYQTLAEERVLITSKWAAAKKLKAPPYQLHQTER